MTAGSLWGGREPSGFGPIRGFGGKDKMEPMKNIPQLKILHLEDNEDDATLIRMRLGKEGLGCSTTVAATQEQFEAALRQSAFDLILSDFSIPGYDGISALETAQSLRPEVPFLFVSGTIGEDKAVETLRSGATDYVLKERLERLGPAIRRALRESSERALREKAEAAREELEERLRHAQKMEAVGQLAGGIAHDFNNLLLVIHGYSEMLLLTESALSVEGRECLRQVLATSDRASNLTRQLLTFSRKQPMALKVLNPQILLSELLRMLRRIVESNIHLDLECEDQLPCVYGDQGMLEQVIMNLVLNARDAMPNGGELRITAKEVALSTRGPSTHPEARPGQFVCLSVQDTGSGIAPEHVLRIFEPFFTTKPLGAGTGLGLSTVYGIVKQHRGWVQVTSQLGKGTTFEVYLPVHTAGTDIPQSEPRPTELPRGTERILLAEDDEAVRKLTARVLEGLGYSVVEADSGNAALRSWMDAGGKFDILLTDSLMNDGLTGQQLAASLRQLKPSLKVIVTSGYGAANADTAPLLNGGFLPKPYSTPALAEAVRRCLDESDA